ncbi:MAG: hypothetical protein EOO16_13225 [Chitinophagaceae bacterium]|nr:MAG: hypothetical protein EOO16_13225 [Chitinophagaceae bacterium]
MQNYLKLNEVRGAIILQALAAYKQECEIVLHAAEVSTDQHETNILLGTVAAAAEIDQLEADILNLFQIP